MGVDRRVIFLALLTANAALTHSAHAVDSDTVRPVFLKYCVECHGADEPSAQIRLDDITDRDDSTEHLLALVHEAIIRGEMPPQDAAQPTAAERRMIAEWIVERASQQRAHRSLHQRRLNRREFSTALQDLTGIPIDFGAGLPADAKTDGFDTGIAALQDAADSVAQWLEVSRRAVESLRFLEPDRNRTLHVDFREHDFTDFRKFIDQNPAWKDEGIFTKSSRLKCVKGVGLYLPTQWAGDRGSSFLAVPAPADKRAALKMTLQVRGKRPLPGLPNPMLWVKIGGDYIDYVPIGDESHELTYAIRMEDSIVEGGVIKIMLQTFVEVPYAVPGFENDDRSKPDDVIPGSIGIYRPKFDRKKLRTPDQQPVPSIVIESIHVDYDYQAAWPPADWKVDTGPISDNDRSARRLLSLWMNRAWRRPVPASEQERFSGLYRRLRNEGFSFDDALRSTFQSVLMGGPFRFLASPSDSDPVVAQHAIASRLSFMLTGSPPDQELRELAASGKLNDAKIIDAQVDRLLADPESRKFFYPFVTQWLNMDQPITLVMSHFRKQDFRFGRHLKSSMKEETIQYVTQLFADNRPAAELVSSDWTMMNDILAVHYGYEGIEGGRLQKVTLKPKPDDQRGGGLLSHAGIQSMLCWMGDNWVIYRGAWTLSHLLDDPPPNPPLEVPELNPFDRENKGKSFRELLAQHQEDRRCSICHRKMDPLGFAFQNFDLSGRWRDVEHEQYHRYELDGKIEWRGEGKTRPVDAKGQLPRGEQFSSFVEFKELLAEHYTEDIVRGIMKKLTLYGTGRKPDVLDLITIRNIMQKESDKDYRLRNLLKALVRSEIFLDG